MGSQISEGELPRLLQRAREQLAYFRRVYRVAPCTQAEEDMALCAMAEAIHSFESHKPGLTAAAVGNVSVRYEKGVQEKQLQRMLFRKASIYLDIRRGVEV